DWDHVALKGRTVNICFDSDVTTTPEVRKALERLTAFLKSKGAFVNVVYLPRAEDGSKVGLDDYLLRHTVEDLQALVEAPRPTPTAAAPQLELLEDPPLTITRPLMLVNGQAVAAIWPYVRVTVTESLDKDGEIKRHNPPITKTEQRLMLVRGDGAIFGDGRRELSEIGADARLSEIPEQDRLWSVRGVNKFLKGERPTPKNVFERIVAIVD